MLVKDFQRSKHVRLWELPISTSDFFFFDRVIIPEGPHDASEKKSIIVSHPNFPSVPVAPLVRCAICIYLYFIYIYIYVADKDAIYPKHSEKWQ